MATKRDTHIWTRPELPASLIPDEAFPVGEADKAGMIEFSDGPIEINAGRECKDMVLINTGDRPIQIGAHYHLFEANRAMAFDRVAAFGFRLDIPSGSAVRFEPGQSRRCQLVRFVGAEVSMGMNDLTNGSMRSDLVRTAAITRAREQGYCFEGDRSASAVRPDERLGSAESDGRAAGSEEAAR